MSAHRGPSVAARNAWARHLPGGTGVDALDLLQGGNLTAQWRQAWEQAPDRRVLFDDATGWTTADQLADRTSRVAGRLAGLGRSCPSRCSTCTGWASGCTAR